MAWAFFYPGSNKTTSHQPTSDLFPILLCSENSSRRNSWFYSLVVLFSSRMTDCELVNTECLSRIFESLSLHIFQFKTVSSSVLLRNILNKISDSLLQRMHTSEQNEKGMTDLTTTVKLKSSEKLIHTYMTHYYWKRAQPWNSCRCLVYTYSSSFSCWV